MACQTECVWKGPESSACPFLCTRSSLKAQSGLPHVGHIVARWFVLKEHQHLKAKWDGHQAAVVVAVFWHHLRRRRRFIRRLEIRPSVKDKLQLQRRKSIKVVLASFLQCNKIRRHVISIDETPLNSQKTRGIRRASGWVCKRCANSSSPSHWHYEKYDKSTFATGSSRSSSSNCSTGEGTALFGVATCALGNTYISAF